MGGHAAGEVASSLVISALAPLDDDDPGDDLLAELRDATVEGNAAITRHVADAPDLDGMGTTLTAILFAGSRLGLVHVGDSRAYQLRDGVFTQITKDDTFVQSLIDEGRITEEEAHTHPQRSLLLRAITGQEVEPVADDPRGPGRRPVPALLRRPVRAWSATRRSPRPLQTYRDPRECADRMIELALRGGGPGQHHVHRRRRRRHRLRRGRPDRRRRRWATAVDDAPPPDSAAARASATTLTRDRAAARRADDATRARATPRSGSGRGCGW